MAKKTAEAWAKDVKDPEEIVSQVFLHLVEAAHDGGVDSMGRVIAALQENANNNPEVERAGTWALIESDAAPELSVNLSRERALELGQLTLKSWKDKTIERSRDNG